MSKKNDPEYVTLKLCYDRHLKIEGRLTRIEVLAGLVTPIATALVIIALKVLFNV